MLWREKEVIRGSPETVAKFKESGKKFFYITNNNCKTRAELADKCKSHTYDATVVSICIHTGLPRAEIIFEKLY